MTALLPSSETAVSSPQTDSTLECSLRMPTHRCETTQIALHFTGIEEFKRRRDEILKKIEVKFRSLTLYYALVKSAKMRS